MGIRQTAVAVLLTAGLALLPACGSAEGDGVASQVEDLLAEHDLHAASEPVEGTLGPEAWKYTADSAQSSSRSIGLKPPGDLEPPLSVLRVDLEDEWDWNDHLSSPPSALSAYFLVDDEEVVGAWLGIEGSIGGVVPLNSPDVIHAGD